jgi:hypothetical protein
MPNKTTTQRASITALTLTCVAWFAMPVHAQEPGEARDEASVSSEPPKSYHNPRGSFVLSPAFGVAVGSQTTAVAVGVGVGYAVLTGVLPGLRGVMIFGDGVAAELSTNLTLTPPLDFYLVPFLYGELGRRFDEAGGAWLYAGGGGLYVGEPAAPFGVQVGWIFRRYVYDAVELDGSGLMVGLTLRL